jgi:hypothetical protein
MLTSLSLDMVEGGKAGITAVLEAVSTIGPCIWL